MLRYTILTSYPEQSHSNASADMEKLTKNGQISHWGEI